MTAREAAPEPCLQRGGVRGRRKLLAWQTKTFPVLDIIEDGMTDDRYYQGSRNAVMTASQLPKRSGRIEHGD